MLDAALNPDGSEDVWCDQRNIYEAVAPAVQWGQAVIHYSASDTWTQILLQPTPLQTDAPLCQVIHNGPVSGREALEDAICHCPVTASSIAAIEAILRESYKRLTD